MQAILVATILYLVFPNAVHAQIVINEFSAKSDPEWVELYNYSDSPVDLEGWEIADGNNYSSDDLTITGILEPFAFLVYEHPKGWLNDSSSNDVIDTIFLYDNSTPSGQLIDSVAYTSTKEGLTTSRLPDGTGEFLYLSEPTQGYHNQAPSTPTQTASPTPSSTLTPTSTPTQTPTSTPTQTSTPTPNSPKSITLTPTSSIVSLTPTITPTSILSSVTLSTKSSVLSSATSSAFNDIFFQESSPSSSPSGQSSNQNRSQNSFAVTGLGLLILASSIFVFRHQSRA